MRLKTTQREEPVKPALSSPGSPITIKPTSNAHSKAIPDAKPQISVSRTQHAPGILPYPHLNLWRNHEKTFHLQTPTPRPPLPYLHPVQNKVPVARRHLPINPIHLDRTLTPCFQDPPQRYLLRSIRDPGPDHCPQDQKTAVDGENPLRKNHENHRQSRHCNLHESKRF